MTRHALTRALSRFRLPIAAAATIFSVVLAGSPAAAEPAAADDDLARRAEIMHGDRWQRAIFEFGQWLDSQQIYTPQEVARIKADFNERVMAMNAAELEYLLDDLDAKLAILETPEARDAKAWLGEYLSVMSDRKRATELRQLPDAASMSAAQLQQEIDRIGRKRATLGQRQQAFDERRQALAEAADTNRQQTAAASAAAAASRSRAAAYSPYRGGNADGSPPFSDTQRSSGMNIGVGPFGAFVNFNLGSF